jgi:hypothetical protein
VVEEFGYFGSSVAAVGDVNADGTEDFVVGSYGSGDLGRAWIFSGATGAVLRTLEHPAPAGQAILGFSVAGVGDVDGDGVPDVIVGDPDDNGRAYVYSGADASVIHELVSPDPPSHGLGRFAWQVDGVGDVDADGRADIAVGAAGDGPWCCGPPIAAGRAYVFSGATGELIHTLVAPGDEVGARFGISLAGLGDIDADGRPEVAAGAHYETAPPSLARSGRAHVFSGATGEVLFSRSSPGAQAEGNFGWSVSSAGDVNADGRPDLAVGANMESYDGQSDAGRLHVMTDLVVAVDDGPRVGPTVVQLTPNPARGAAAAVIHVVESGRYRASVFDATGREIVSVFDETLGTGTHRFAIGTGLPAGRYALRVLSPAGVRTEYLVIVR